MKTIVRIKFGSHLYGTNTLESDLDYKSVHLPSAREILLQRVPGSVSNRKSKSEGEKNLPGDVDEESYSLQRYLGLLAEGQTVALDMLFAPPSNQVESSLLWKKLVYNKHRFLSKKSASFLGYCRQQANKYGIRGSRVAAAKEASELFGANYAPYGQQTKVESLAPILEQLAKGEHCDIVEQPIGSSGELGLFFECCGRKVAFNATVRQAHEIFSKIYQNYGDRARKAQENEGVDWKALSHAVRVGEEAIELLETGHITFPLPRASHILNIKCGAHLYEEVAEEIEHLLIRVEEASEKSILPETADTGYIDEFVAEVYEQIVKGEL